VPSKNTENSKLLDDSIPCGKNPYANWNNNFCGPLHRSGIWTCRATGPNIPHTPLDTWIGFTKCVDIDSSATYYLGIAGDNQVRFFLDGVLQVQMLPCEDPTALNFFKWRIYPISLSQGRHIIQMEGYNCTFTSNENPASFGAEIYNNTVAQLVAATTMSDLNIIFSTRQMVGQQLDIGHFSCPSGYVLNNCDSPSVCQQIVSTQGTVNPYFTGMLGNWRGKSQYAYQVSRENISNDPAALGRTNIRKSGAYSVFNPFWQYNPSLLKWDNTSAADNRWIAANEVTYFNKKGLELENKDALNRYSAALFGYLESIPIAVGSNTRYRELAYDGFEDYGFRLDCADTVANCDSGHFGFRKKLNGNSIDTTSQYAHSGKYSLKLNGTISLRKTVYTGEPASVYTFSNNGGYIPVDNELAKGFSPIPGKKYVLSFWIKDASPRNAATTVSATVNGISLVNPLSKWPVVEGWKRVEQSFLLPDNAASFNLQIQSGGGNVYLDDIRIHPYDGQMKSFAYDASTQRLMAELDENNFAAFYEYDDEGTLIRVKKETERGIMTIKETRSGYRKK
jgi:hypothetical protein